MQVPAVLFKSPDGRREAGLVEVGFSAFTPARQESFKTKLELIQALGLEVCFERNGGGLVVYLTDDEFDYKIEIVGTHELPDTVIKLVEKFDEVDYQFRRRQQGFDSAEKFYGRVTV